MMDILKVALSQYGVTETKGTDIDNPEVVKYFHETGHLWVNHDETPWCDAFMDWCAKETGLKHSPGLNARGWLKEGTEVKPEEVAKLILEVPVLVIFWRIAKESIYGHVGLVPLVDRRRGARAARPARMALAL